MTDEKPGSKVPPNSIAGIPTIEYYQKTYAGTMSNNDQKAIRVFHDYESHEKFRRLQQELLWIKDDLVKEAVLDRVLSKKRKVKYESYKKWAEFMLVWLSSLRK